MKKLSLVVGLSCSLFLTPVVYAKGGGSNPVDWLNKAIHAAQSVYNTVVTKAESATGVTTFGDFAQSEINNLKSDADNAGLQYATEYLNDINNTYSGTINSVAQVGVNEAIRALPASEQPKINVAAISARAKQYVLSSGMIVAVESGNPTNVFNADYVSRPQPYFLAAECATSSQSPNPSDLTPDCQNFVNFCSSNLGNTVACVKVFAK